MTFLPLKGPEGKFHELQGKAVPQTLKPLS